MTDITNMLKENKKLTVACKDGFKFRICVFPSCFGEKIDGKWESIECSNLNKVDYDLIRYAANPSYPMTTQYYYVPISVLNNVIDKHGGMWI